MVDLRLQKLAQMCIRGDLADAEFELRQWVRHHDCPATARILLASLLARRNQPHQALMVLGTNDLNEDPRLRWLRHSLCTASTTQEPLYTVPADTTCQLVGLDLTRLAPAACAGHRLQDAHANTIYAALQQRHPQDGRIWILAGRIADARGEYKTAIDFLRQAIYLNNCNPTTTWKQLALIQMHGGYFDDAIRSWRKVTRQAPTATEAWAGIVVCATAAHRHHGLIRQGLRVLRQLATKPMSRTIICSLWPHAAAAHAWQTEWEMGDNRSTVIAQINTLPQSRMAA